MENIVYSTHLDIAFGRLLRDGVGLNLNYEKKIHITI